MHGAVALFHVLASNQHPILRFVTESLKVVCRAPIPTTSVDVHRCRGSRSVSPYEVAFNAYLLVMSLVGNWSSAARVVRNQTVDGLSMTAMSMGSWSCISWCVYAALQSQFANLFANAIGLVGIAVVLAVGYRTGAVRVRRLVAGTSLWTLLFIGSLLIGGVVPAAVLLTVLTITLRAPQAIESWRNPGGQGVSLAANLLGCVQCASWVVYGWLCQDVFTVLTAGYCLAHVIFVSIRTAQGRRRKSVLLIEARSRAAACQVTAALAPPASATGDRPLAHAA